VYEGIIPAEIQSQAIAVWYSTAALESSIRSPTIISLVAEVEGRVAGFLDLAVRSGGVAELSRIYVLPNEQGKGIGWALLVEALACARTGGVGEVWVAVARDNGRARTFYERNGFMRVEIRTVDLFGFSLEEATYTLDLVHRPRGEDRSQS